MQSNELILAGCSSPDPFSTQLLLPRTGVSEWSHKGNELQGGCIGKVLPLGRSGEHIIVSLKDRPFIHVVGLNSQERFMERTSVSGVVTDFTTTSDGSLLFIAIEKKIFVYQLLNGELLGVKDVHLQNITQIALSSDDALLVTASDDGSVRVFYVSSLVSNESLEPICEWRVHSLSVTGLSLSSSSSLRIASCSRDHTACIYSVAMNMCLLRICCDRPLSSVLLCPTETRVFLGTDQGGITVMSLLQVAKKDEMEVKVSTTNKHTKDFVLEGRHSEGVTCMTVNNDGSLLCSGDAAGKYVIWQIASKQVLKESSMPGPISSLSFVPLWTALANKEDKTIDRPKWNLQRTINDKLSLPLNRRSEVDNDKEWLDVVESRLGGGKSVEARKESKGDVDEVIRKLKEENARLLRINNEMYEFTAKEVLGLSKNS